MMDQLKKHALITSFTSIFELSLFMVEKKAHIHQVFMKYDRISFFSIKFLDNYKFNTFSFVEYLKMKFGQYNLRQEKSFNLSSIVKWHHKGIIQNN